LLPAAVKTDEEQISQAHTMLERCANDLDRYIYLMGLQDRNERLFYRVLASDIGNMMPLVYTPTVGNLFTHLFITDFVFFNHFIINRSRVPEIFTNLYESKRSLHFNLR
jgi:hypothetical protein